MSKRKETYLGDGVYARHDGGGTIRLDLRAQDLSVICLEPAVLVALIRFALDCGILKIRTEQSHDDHDHSDGQLVL